MTEHTLPFDWLNPALKISKHFTVKDALWLPKWDRLATWQDGLSEDAKQALLFLFAKMDGVREFVGLPINVHVAYRPRAYNSLVGGSRHSSHVARMEEIGSAGALIAAVDWSADTGDGSPGECCDTLRAAIAPKLETWGLRMEDNPTGSPWIHLDTRPVLPGHQRYFLP